MKELFGSGDSNPARVVLDYHHYSLNNSLQIMNLLLRPSCGLNCGNGDFGSVGP